MHSPINEAPPGQSVSATTSGILGCNGAPLPSNSSRENLMPFVAKPVLGAVVSGCNPPENETPGTKDLPFEQSENWSTDGSLCTAQVQKISCIDENCSIPADSYEGLMSLNSSSVSIGDLGQRAENLKRSCC